MGGEAALYLDEIEEREVRPAAIARTKPLYPTDGPGDGRSWNDYFKAAKAMHTAEPEEDEEPDEIEVIIPGYDLAPDEIATLGARTRLGQFTKRLRARDWDVRVLRSVARIPAVRYAADGDDYQAGDIRYPEHELETKVLVGVKRAEGGFMAVEATWDSKKGYRIAKTFDPWLGEEIRVGCDRPREQNAIEAEGGVDPPMALKDWLNIVAPAPEAKKRAPKKAEPKEEWRG